MNEPWFSPQYAWIPGTVLGVLCGVWGSLLGVFGSRGKCKTLIYSLYSVLMICGTASLLLGIAAFFMKQPYGVWYGLGLGGLIVVIVGGCNGFTMRNVYRAAEERKIAATDL